jgi:hypothetical protein
VPEKYAAYRCTARFHAQLPVFGLALHMLTKGDVLSEVAQPRLPSYKSRYTSMHNKTMNRILNRKKKNLRFFPKRKNIPGMIAAQTAIPNGNPIA